MYVLLVSAKLPTRLLSWGGVGGWGSGWDVNLRFDMLTCPLLLFMCLVSVTLRMLSWGGVGGLGGRLGGGLGGGWDVNIRCTPNVLLGPFCKAAKQVR